LRSIAKGKAGEHPLLGPWQVEWTAVDQEVEPAEQMEHTSDGWRLRASTLPFHAHLPCPNGEQQGACM
jgi:hypothetical protein